MKKTVVLDWDGTLALSFPMLAIDSSRKETALNNIGGTIELSLSRDGVKGEYGLVLRPGIKNFLSVLRQKYQVLLWSFGVERYIYECLHKANLRSFFHENSIVTREKMARMNTDLKDLYLLTKLSPLNEIVIVDDSNELFGILNPLNCIDAPTYSMNTTDHFLDVLPHLIDFHFKNILSTYTEEQLIVLRKDIIYSLTPRAPKFAYD